MTVKIISKNKCQDGKYTVRASFDGETYQYERFDYLTNAKYQGIITKELHALFSKRLIYAEAGLATWKNEVPIEGITQSDIDDAIAHAEGEIKNLKAKLEALA